ncbi:MAG TPA: TonB family protein [Gammaproteobacteria bacterium]|jgi:TonB family protein
MPIMVRFAGALILLATGSWQAGAHAQDAPPPAAEAPAENQPAQEPEASAATTTRFEAEIEVRRLLAAEQYAEAAGLGPQWISLTETEFGPQSLEAADAYATLAAAQSKLGEHDEAEDNYLHALGIYRETAGPFDVALIEPLLGLGDTYQASGAYTNAVSMYNEARTVNRRVYGLQNEGQIEMLDRLTEAYGNLNQPLEAHEQQLEALQLVARNHEPGSPEALEAVYKYALWLRAAHRYTEEREQYFRAERIIIDSHGEDSLLLVRPLRERAISFRVQGSAAPQGIGALRDALAIVEAQENPDALTLAEILRDIGDWDVAFGRVGTLGTEYVRSWNLLGDVPNGADLRTSWYGGIETVLNAPLSPRSLTNDPSAPRGHVLVRFDIDPAGRSQNVTVVSSDPVGLKDEAVARHIRESRFRPNLVDGQLVVTRGRALDVVFRYTPSEPSASQN